MKIISDKTDLKNVLQGWRAENNSIGLVPTMGALHNGHLSLIKIAAEKTDKVVATIFVNPKQFAPHEDFEVYPRDTKSDLEQFQSKGVDLVYTPEAQDIYPDNFATHFDIGGPNIGLDSDHRPHFFNGVAVVVCKLLNQVRPDVAVFGEKDYQQLCVIRQMVSDLDMDVDIVGGPLVRDENGLALSSRNAYLSDEDCQIAIQLNKILFAAASALSSRAKSRDLNTKIDSLDLSTSAEQSSAFGRDDITKILDNARQDILAAGFDSVDYLELREEKTLKPIQDLQNKTARLIFAGWVGKTRLLDNMKI